MANMLDMAHADAQALAEAVRNVPRGDVSTTMAGHHLQHLQGKASRAVRALHDTQARAYRTAAEQARYALRDGRRGILLRHGGHALQRTYGTVRITGAQDREVLAVDVKPGDLYIEAMAAAWAEIVRRDAVHAHEHGEEPVPVVAS